MKKLSSIPIPKTYGPLGNLPLIDKTKVSQSLWKIADEMGPIFQFQFADGIGIFVSSHELVSEVCDETRFDKNMGKGLLKVREFSGDGLFTSWTDEPNWRKAHNILLPSFSQKAMKGYHSMMQDIAVQLIQKWSRLNQNESIDVPEDMTRLTLDTIGLCGFNYRFNSFYREGQHPFIESMVRGLNEAMRQTKRFELQDKLMVKTRRQFNRDVESMFSLVDRIIAERKQAGGQSGNDLLSLMLHTKDPETGEKLDDENIRYQIITFLIAGHETTSGLLSFALYLLLKHPDKLQKAYEEADRVLTEPVPSYKQVQQLKYIRMILNESIRLWPTAPAFSLYAKEETVIGGKYLIPKGQGITVLIPKLHRDQSVWGEDAEAFRPERFEQMDSIPQHAYKPFGNGQRACIGMQFALHEATLVLGMILQHFELEDHTNYHLAVKESLTLKPEGFTIRVKPRKKQMLMTFPAQTAEQKDPQEERQTKPAGENTHGIPFLVLYGSNLGTAEGIAKELADQARLQGYKCETAELDQYQGRIPKEGAVIIVTASYNGNPPDNAKDFIDWLEHGHEEDLSGVKYAVFGCGNRSWASTYQRIPRLIDSELEKKGAHRLLKLGEGDAGDDFEGQFEAWQNDLWPVLRNAFSLAELIHQEADRQELSVEFVSTPAASPLAKAYQAFTAQISANRELQYEDSGRSTRHLEISLPEGISFLEGDHLGVLPQNSMELIERVFSRFGLSGNEQVLITGEHHTAHLPQGRPVDIKDLFQNSLELQEPATRAQLRELAAHTVCPPHKRELEELLEAGVYKERVLKKRVSMLDLLEQYPACELPFARFLALLPSLKPRYYSISSSPLQNERQTSITVAVVSGPALSGRGQYSGVASNYLAGLSPGDSIACFIRQPQSGFRLPADPETPIIMVGPGTGIAPYRGFLQARRIQQNAGINLGEAHLYFGCRHPEQDYLYQRELEKAAQDGLVHLHTAFSRLEGRPKTYVQDLMKVDSERLIHLLDNGARLYVCGDGSRMAPAVEQTLCEAYEHVYQASQEEAQNWISALQEEGRYAKDVWDGGDVSGGVFKAFGAEHTVRA
ncbi:bifunctional cytochrome P450/NADPH--P450 reductase [Bacillus swezeyi]|uniref:Bifunctional cytochrome P450/NADPH--P450 reductase n=1 Tax=Bacillus swezeyi TaxID=1925020 RepID=A0A1R1QSN2_9BACI|nr:bifunctional cytochrome P450/NADPH--P450 reductase [Bacillus swezeyi]MEC1261357.1 bifunctional cytochrome P450/NADPH--P450 reductase [Bacillus swezeyi]MED2929170.1 bifunctional cytochrome P450/NADPH--P450 reductase [Bacillus swezeyi]MED2940971.1 bifunctional cytochrome P450/NADPH--P450 reductase [Bacillus swezeyi]MED2963801.1 bifunctional cytochrome P450/NADPH--P450 reductase [Bacillus swezeyi]MED2975467.1 bifunctional cytochrome P450/NADPH--P450 reductase [Bacillus swezeyi]